MSCVEIYNEVVTDLMSPAAQQSRSLPVRHDKSRGFYVEGLAQHQVQGLPQALGHMHSALLRRHVGSHKLNPNSTRSHCIMTLHIESTNAEQDRLARQQSSAGAASRPSTGAATTAADSQAPLAPGRKFGKLVLVDLAGSERLKETGQTAESALREAANINRSLFALGKVLSALSTRRRGGGAEDPSFVPYRDSKLTQLLYDGLKGTGRVLMVACCAPTKLHIDETLNTLHFAQTALHIRSEPVVVLDPHDQLVWDLKSTIVQLRAENRKLAKALQMVAEGKELEDALESAEGPNLSRTLRSALGLAGEQVPSPARYRPKTTSAYEVYGGTTSAPSTGAAAK